MISPMLFRICAISAQLQIFTIRRSFLTIQSRLTVTMKNMQGSHHAHYLSHLLLISICLLLASTTPPAQTAKPFSPDACYNALHQRERSSLRDSPLERRTARPS